MQRWAGDSEAPDESGGPGLGPGLLGPTVECEMAELGARLKVASSASVPLALLSRVTSTSLLG